MSSHALDPSLLADIKTYEDSLAFVHSLTKLETALFSLKTSTVQKLDEHLTHTQKQAIIDYCQKRNIDIDNTETFREFIVSLRESIETIPRVSVTLAFTPRSNFVDEVSQWFLTNYKKKVIIDIDVSPWIGGGALFLFNGSHCDHSLKTLLGEYTKRALQEKDPLILNNEYV